MDATEDQLVAAIGRVLSGLPPQVLVGPGDDAAVVAPGAGELLLTADLLVEGVHFDRSLTSARDLGYKAMAANVSDIAAMGASPRYAVVSLALSDAVDAAWVMELYGGMREACDEHALSLVGGDLSSGELVVIAVTVTGEAPAGRAVRRSGARVGDRLVVTGALGASSAGLRLARSGATSIDEPARELLRAHFRPVARVGEGSVLSRHGATAMMDVSDGLALDLARLTAASGVGARVRLQDVPVATGARLPDALEGGEDYELLACLSTNEAVRAARAELREAFGVALTDIGEIIERGLVAVDADGSERPLEAKGWDHFGG